MFFYKKAWNFVGQDVCKAIKEYFSDRKYATFIALVPKLQTPMRVSDLIPIACCNVVDECISKVITNRVKKHFGKLVSFNHKKNNG